jgi:hypothetical protein
MAMSALSGAITGKGIVGNILGLLGVGGPGSTGTSGGGEATGGGEDPGATGHDTSGEVGGNVGGGSGGNVGGQSGTAGMGGFGGGIGAEDGAGAGGDGGGGGSGGNGGGGGICCFVAGTKIGTPNGPVNIEDIKVSDTVNQYDIAIGHETSGIVGRLKTVEHLGYYEVRFVSGNILKLTNDHPLFTSDGWAAINPEATRGNRAYDKLTKINQLTSLSYVKRMHNTVDQVESITFIPGDITTYTLGDVKPYQNFYADGYLASNWC